MTAPQGALDFVAQVSSHTNSLGVAITLSTYSTQESQRRQSWRSCAIALSCRRRSWA